MKNSQYLLTKFINSVYALKNHKKYLMKYDQIEIDNAKKNISCKQIICQYIKDVHKYPTSYRINCPFHAGDNYSMDIKDNTFLCYNCDIGGDLISLVASLEYNRFIPKPSNEEFDRVMEVLGVGKITEQAPVLHLSVADAKESDLALLYIKSLEQKEKAVEYFASRNIYTDATNIGFLKADNKSEYTILQNNDFVVFPMYNVINNIVTTDIVGLNLRNINASHPRLKHRKIGTNGAFLPLRNNTEAFEYDLKDYIICESGTDALKIKDAVSVFGTGSMSKISNCRALVIDSDKAGFDIAAATDMNILLCDKADAAESDHVYPLQNFSINIINEIVAIALYTQDILILDELLPALEKAASVSPIISTIYNIIISCSPRTIQVFSNKLYRRMKMRRLKFIERALDTQGLANDIKELRDILIALPGIYENIKHREADIVEIADDIMPEMTASLMTDSGWKVMETGLYNPNNALLKIRTNITPKKIIIPSLSAEFRHASLWVIVGFPGAGKTTTAGLIATEYYLNEQPHVPVGKIMIFSFEMAADEFYSIITPYLKSEQDLNSFDIITGVQCLDKIATLIAAAARIGYTFFVIDHAKLLASVDGTSMLEHTVIKLNLISQKLGVTILIITQPLKDVKKDGYYLDRANSYGGSALVDKCSVFIALQGFMPVFDKKSNKKILIPMSHVSYGKIRYQGRHGVSGDILHYNFDTKKLTRKASTLDIVKTI